MKSEHLTREEWEALHLLVRASGVGPGQGIVTVLQNRSLIDTDLSLTAEGKALHTKFDGSYPPRPTSRNFIGQGRR
ncbi:hypothetical protein [Novosphingobium sp. AP12]|uniref:hypothetical protein n=1 Tax=Novosphingobium sp. AP12 TaxID=1144305 RepID=UPI00027205D4|nr:hypothetical protein [Novosphingobium sp. AP12]EJL23952.1 hypothetical protein PMI02_03872 [Novosphingobium sp. AP12]